MKKFTLFISIALLTACGASDNSESNSKPSSAQLPTELQELAGSWQEPCEIDLESNDSSTSIETYSSEGVNFNTVSYLDTDCNTELYSMRINATLEYVGETILNSGETVKKVTATMSKDKILLLIHSESLKRNYIENAVCSRTDWDQGKFIDIAKCDDFDEFADIADNLKSVYYVDGSNAYWGNINSPLDNEGYPTTLDAIPNTKL